MGEPENVKAVMMGPCCVCGDTGYPPSMGGPHICPSCDAGNFTAATVARQAKVIKQLQEQVDSLKHPYVVYQGMLRGGIAMPTWAQIKHLYKPQIDAENTPSDGAIYAAVSQREMEKRQPGYDWSLSEEAKLALAEIDRNIREAPANIATFPKWCPGCSREVGMVCHHFNCAVGPNGLDAQPHPRSP